MVCRIVNVSGHNAQYVLWQMPTVEALWYNAQYAASQGARLKKVFGMHEQEAELKMLRDLSNASS